MVNASLNWASIVGIVLAVCGGGLYFLRSFKPALARDYDVFFAAIGLLCGGILFFQGWRLDPILQFGQFLLAGTTVFFAYESVRLRGIATDQARRSSFFDDDQMPSSPRNGSRNRWDDEYDQFEETERSSRRFKSREIDSEDEDDRYPVRRRASRAIPESASSRRRPSSREANEFDDINMSRRSRFSSDREDFDRRRNSNSFGERRTTRSEEKRGSRPLANKDTSRSVDTDLSNQVKSKIASKQRSRNNIRSQSAKNKVEDASFTQNSNNKATRQPRRSVSNSKGNVNNQSGRYTVGTKKDKPRDNSSRFDD